MTLATHAVVGAAAASLIPTHPFLGFIAGFASHFAIDAVPHWEYSLASAKIDKDNLMNSDLVINENFFSDILKIGFDAMLGIVLSLIFFQSGRLEIFSIPVLGAIAGILPDPLQFVYWKCRCQPFIALQKFHLWIHAKTNLKEKPVLGIFYQLCIIFVIAVIARQ